MKKIAAWELAGVTNSSVADLSFDRSDRSIARSLVLTGYLVSALFLGSVFTWAAIVPISSAAIASGVVGKDGYRKTVQHLEGGIIHAILVKDGDTVAAGQTVIELADVQARSDFDLLQKQKSIAAAKEASLLAAQLGKDEVRLPEWLDLDSADVAVRDAIEGHIEAYMTINRIHREQLAIVGRQIERAKQKIQALDEERLVLEKSRQLVEEELAQYQSLQAEGLVTRQATFDLRRQIVDNDVAASSNRVGVQSTEQEINDLKMERSSLTAAHSNRIEEELDSVRRNLVQLEERLSKTEDTLGRTIIRAPTSGVVVNLKVNTIGGVISPGEPLLDIVPSTGNLIVDARVNPMDRDTVNVGQSAEVRFSAFNRRLTDPLKGRVALISADRLTDAVTNESYYRAKIELLDDPATVLDGGQVYSGMQAEVLIVTGSRTALSYLTAPISKSFNRAFRED